YAGAVPPGTPAVPSREANAALLFASGVKIVLSASVPVQVRALHQEPALSRLPPLIRTPTGPLSKRTPTSGLSNLLSSSIERTPSPYISSSSRSIWASSQVG